MPSPIDWCQLTEIGNQLQIDVLPNIGQARSVAIPVETYYWGKVVYLVVWQEGLNSKFY